MKSTPNIRSALWVALLFLNPAILTSQNIPNAYFSSPQTIVCPYDSSTFWGFPEWTAFQTDDSTRWGQQDSACIPIAIPGANNASIGATAYDATRPVYLNAHLVDDSASVPLDSNNLYKISVYNSFSNTGGWDFSTNCKEDLCTGTEIGIEVPDSAGTGYNVRWYKYQPQAGEFYYEFCIPTERFPNGNSIRRAWLKYTSSSGLTVLDTVRTYSIAVEDMGFYTEKIRSLATGTFNGTSYEYYMNTFTGSGCPAYFCSNKLLMYNDSTYPSVNNISYVEAAPIPNTTTQENVDIIVDWDAYLIYQPFVEIRGAEVVGDTLRHTFNLINNGGTVCTYGFIDIVFEHGNNYTHREGKVSFGSKQACMLFGRGSTLEVADGTTFDYGKPGRGMLALKSGGKVTIGQGSELVIHNKLIFGEYEHDPEPADIHIYLNRSSKLTFAEGSELSNQLSKFKGRCFLNVHMRGGVLDDSGLSEEDRKLIRRIYDDPHQELADNLEILGNPFSDNLTFSILGAGDESLELKLYGTDGKIYQEKALSIKKGYNSIELSGSALPAGVYILQVDNGLAQTSKRVLKIN